MDDQSPEQRDFAARQKEHAERVHLERELQRQSGKSLSQVRTSLRADDADARLRRYADAVRRGNEPAPQRPPPPAVQVTEVTLPKKQIIPGTSMTPGSVGDPGAGASGSLPPPPDDSVMYVLTGVTTSGVTTLTWMETGTVGACDGTDDVTVITILPP